MRHISTATSTALILVLACTTDAVGAGRSATPTDIVVAPGAEGTHERAALIAAIALLPENPTRVAVMDVTLARPGVRERLLELDAFTIKDNGVIYVVKQSELLRRAGTGAAVYRAMLATVIWHEMAHLAKADERAARQAEEQLWTRLLRDGVTDPITGLRYLAALKNRPDDQLLALGPPVRVGAPAQ